MATIDYNIQSVQPMQRTQVDQQAQPVQKTPSTLSVQRNESAVNGEVLPSEQAQKRNDPQRLEAAVSQISEFVQNFQRDLAFSVDKESGRMVIKVIDSRTREVIRQIPAEEVLRVSRNLQTPDSLILREQA